jgi:hypothetical protein
MKGDLMTTASLRLPATELSKLEPVRPRGVDHAAAPAAQPRPVPRRLRRAIHEVLGYARA